MMILNIITGFYIFLFVVLGVFYIINPDDGNLEFDRVAGNLLIFLILQMIARTMI